MPINLEQKIQSIESKASLLLKKYEALAAERSRVFERLGEAQKEIDRLKSENERLKTDLEFFKIASVIETKKSDIEATKKFLSDIVWEIDRCIKQLSE